MVVDTSVIMAILQLEPEAEDYARAIERATVRLVSSVSVLEAGIVVQSRKGPEGGRELDTLIREAGLEVVPFTAEQADVARLAHDRFGKGKNRAGLNMGDCAAYALSKTAAEPLLFKGNDFARSDVDRVRLP